MNLETAQKINTAACYVGLAKLGVLAAISAEHVRIVAGCSIAQLQTAKDTVEAENERRMDSSHPGPRTISCTCEDGLLAGVKALADHLVGSIPE